MNNARWYVDQLLNVQSADKRLGQHFLIDDDLLGRIVDYGEVQDSDHVLEIGPGPGTLTSTLLSRGCKVTAVEIDEGAVHHLNEIFENEIHDGQLSLLNDDVLKYTFPSSINKVIANIPYQISSPLLEQITSFHRQHTPLDVVVLLVQEEFAERLEMKTSDTVGTLGLVTSLDFEVSLFEKVSPDSFIPHPKVYSRIVGLMPQQIDLPCDRKLLIMVMRHCFYQRRKKLRTLLKTPPKRINRVNGWYQKRWIEAYNSLRSDEQLDARPEEFSLEDWVTLILRFEKHAS